MRYLLGFFRRLSFYVLNGNQMNMLNIVLNKIIENKSIYVIFIHDL